MRKDDRFAGYTVQVAPLLGNQKMAWTAWLTEFPVVHATRPTLAETRQALAEEWARVLDAYREAGETVPNPQHKSGRHVSDHRRILATLRRLKAWKSEPIF